MLLATTAPILGYATFGKRDGFEIFSIGGLLRHFQDEDGSNMLSQAIQLRLEDIRIYDQTEIWGFSRFFWKNNWIHIFLHYRYALDVYNRDGYHAAAIALREVWANENDIISCLRTAVDTITGPSTPRMGFSVPWNHEMPHWPKYTSSQQAFVSLPDQGSRTPTLLYQLIRQDPYNQYNRVWASASARIRDNISDPEIHLIDAIGRDPDEIPDPAANTYEENLPIFHPDREDSLIYAYEDANNAFWKKNSKESLQEELKSRKKAIKGMIKAFLNNIRKS